jgi:hypothetical protein
MEHCAFCKTQETQSYEYGVPVCRDCIDITVSRDLAEALEEKVRVYKRRAIAPDMDRVSNW